MDKDWSDTINPVLMKELRQGLRSKQFEVSLVLLQVLLTLMALAEVFCQDYDDERAIIQSCFWSLITFMVCVLLPGQGLLTIRSEYKANTFAPMCLTKLTAKQVVRGKWFTLVLQSMLWISTLFPYILIRYLLGRHELIHDLFGIAALFLAALPLMAAAICLSAIREVVVQFGVIVTFAVAFWFTSTILFVVCLALDESAPYLMSLPVVFGSFMLTSGILELADVHTSLAGWGRTFRGGARPGLPIPAVREQGGG